MTDAEVLNGLLRIALYLKGRAPLNVDDVLPALDVALTRLSATSGLSIIELAKRFHHEHDGDGGCAGESCPCVQQLADFAGSVIAPRVMSIVGSSHTLRCLTYGCQGPADAAWCSYCGLKLDRREPRGASALSQALERKG